MPIATVPDRPYGVDHRFGRQIARKRNDRMAGRTFALLLPYGFAGFQQLRSCSPVDSPVHTASPHQGGIGRIDDDVDVHGRNITMNNFNLRFHKAPLQPAFLLSVSQGCTGEKTIRKNPLPHKAEERTLSILDFDNRERFFRVKEGANKSLI